MYCLSSFLILATLASSCIGQPKPTENYPHTAVLDPNEQVKLYWKFDDVFIIFEIHGNTTGWIGMGISPTGSMAQADIVVGWVKNSVAEITDRYGTENTFPPLDPESNVDLLEGAELEGWTVIKYRRQLASCEEEFDLPITSDTLRIIYAYGMNDPKGEDISYEDYHNDNRGVKSLLLLEKSESGENVYPEGETHSHFDLTNDEFEIPADTTYYNCRLHKIPEFAEKRHLVTVEPIIQPGNELYVHHMVVYQCRNSIINDESVGANTKCYGSNMPTDFYSCSFVIQAWAIGGMAIQYPRHTGFPLGESDSPKYVVVETHYDNPLNKSGVIDSSGLRFIYTGNLRSYDAGILETGLTVSGIQNIIPPNADSFLSYGECTANCLSQGMKQKNEEKINVFGALLHSHLLGQGMTLRHVRDGVELPYIAKDGSYDFNYQETRMLAKERVILPGDNLQVVCDYKTKGVRENMTVGGLDTEKEMCIVYMYYYPKLSINFCETAPEIVEFLNYFGIEEIKFPDDAFSIYYDISDAIITKPDEIAGQSMADYLNAMTWNDTTNKKLSDDLRDIGRIHNCRGLSFIPGIEDFLPALVVDTPYVEEPDQCVELNSTESPIVDEYTTPLVTDEMTTTSPADVATTSSAVVTTKSSSNITTSLPSEEEKTTTGGAVGQFLYFPIYVFTIITAAVLY